MFAMTPARMARNRPSASSASSAVAVWSRAWVSDRNASLRSLVQRTVRPNRRAAQTTSAYSG